MTNARKTAQGDMLRLLGAHAFRATVTVVAGNAITVRRDGSTDAEGPYGKLASYASPQAGDKVICLVPGGIQARPVVLGEELV